MLKPLALVLLLSITLALTAQQYSSKVLGKVTMPNGADLTVAVDSAGTVILSTPAHSIYVDRPTAMNLENSLDAILAGMKDLEAKDISVVDYRMIGRLVNGGSQDASQDSIMFRLRAQHDQERQSAAVDVLHAQFGGHVVYDDGCRPAGRPDQQGPEVRRRVRRPIRLYPVGHRQDRFEGLQIGRPGLGPAERFAARKPTRAPSSSS